MTLVNLVLICCRGPRNNNNKKLIIVSIILLCLAVFPSRNLGFFLFHQKLHSDRALLVYEMVSSEGYCDRGEGEEKQNYYSSAQAESLVQKNSVSTVTARCAPQIVINEIP